ncbi:MAG: hypothetical protein ACI9FD_003732 [Gammaproteobacteria bacterium]
MRFIFIACLILASSVIQAKETFVVCYNFTCRSEWVVVFNDREWRFIDAIFSPAADTPEQERQQIMHGIKWMEEFVGRYTPTHRDLARNYTKFNDNLDDDVGQLDCIDESLNTTTYLKAFEQRKLLRYHQVMDRAMRRAFWNQHWAGRVQEKESGDTYIVDSWFRDNGEFPYVLSEASWQDLSVSGRNSKSKKGANLLTVLSEK